jgi:hypothetical protein
MSFQITGLNPEPFRHLFGLSDDALKALGAKRYVVDKSPGFPDRIEMRDMEIGETALLLNHVHQPAATPYQASHAIFIREGAETAYHAVDRVPEVLGRRLLSLRAYDAQHMMVGADVIEGRDTKVAIERFFDNPAIAYIHIHNAKPGCFAALVERV